MKLSTPETIPNNPASIVQTSNASVSTVDVLVARTAIPAGTVITPAMVDKQPWPQPLVLADFIVSNSPGANIIGKVTRSGFQAREPFIASKLAATTDTGFLAAGLPAGMRAITIPTDTVSGVAGYVFPGDRVDLVFTHNVPQDIQANNDTAQKNGGNVKPGYAEVLAANVPVLAINVRENTVKTENAGPAANAASSTVPSSMTLQVSDVEAEKIRLAEKVGTLSIALRSINDRNNAAPTPPANLSSLTQVAGTQPVEQPENVRVIRNGDNSK